MNLVESTLIPLDLTVVESAFVPSDLTIEATEELVVEEEYYSESVSRILNAQELAFGTRGWMDGRWGVGFDDNPFMTKDDYARVYTEVARYFPGITLKDWWEASPGQRAVYIETTLARRRAERVPQENRGSEENVPQQSSDCIPHTVSDSSDTAAPLPNQAVDVQSARSKPLTKKEVTVRLERLREQGEKWTNYRAMGEQIGCASSTVYKCISTSQKLCAWAGRSSHSTPSPRATSIDGRICDSTEQVREPQPEDAAAIKEYLDQNDLQPEERAFFLSLSTEDQLEFLDDPDQHCKVLGRKP